MIDCIWNTPAEDRHCRFCCWDRGCGKRPRNDRLPEGNYLQIMNGIVGYDITTRGRQPEKVHCRYIVAYQMAMDSYSQFDIARLLKLNRSTISQGVSAVRDMLMVPYSYPREIDIWKEFEKSVNKQKKDYEKEQITEVGAVPPAEPEG